MPPPLDPFYPYRLAHWAVVCWLNLPYILILSAATSAAIAAITFYVHWKALREERWLFYFGAAFLTLALQYGVKAGVAPGHGDVLFIIGSAVNNILFFLAAWLLRDWATRLPSRRLRAAIIGLAFLPVFPVALHWPGIHERWPDDVVSFICFTYVGVAIATNIDYRRGGLRIVAFLVALFYGFLHLVYALVPVAVTMTAFAPMWGAIAAIPLPPDSSLPSVAAAVDAMILATLIPMKAALFVTALVLMIRALVVLSPDETRSLFADVANTRRRTLEPLGLAKAIGETCAADDVELCYLVPGDEHKRVIRLHWGPEAGRVSGPDWQRPQVLPSPATSVVAAVFGKKRPLWSLKHSGVDTMPNPPAGSHVACPILFHGAIIGVLKIEWQRQRAFPPSMLRRIERVAELAAPGVQARRQLAALDACSARFAQVERTTTPTSELIPELARAIQETLTPLATGLLVNAGFVPQLVVVGDGPAEAHAGGQATDAHMGDILRRLAPNPGDDTTIEPQPVKSHKLPLGSLALSIPAQRDGLGHPTIADDPLHRRAVAQLLGDALLDGFRRHFAALLHELQIKLSSDRGESHHLVVAAVADAAKGAGMLWSALEHQGQRRFVGDTLDVDLQACLAEAPSEIREQGGLLFCGIARHENPTRLIIGVPVTGTETRLWFGLGRSDVKDTLQPETPWHGFLRSIADALRPVIQRIQAAQQVEALQTEAAQFHGLATAAVTTGTLVHQIANLANELDYGVRAVHDGLRFSSPDWSEQQRPLLERQTDLLTDVERAGDVLRALLGPLLNVTKLDTRRPCRLVDVLDETRKLLAGSLRLHDIQLDVDVPSVMSIDMPLHVATFAVANLVANAKDAIGHHGKIRIVAREEPPFLVCDVSDNGPGIPVDIRPRLFELGVTTKADSGGWGLYLARKSLSENRGALDLARAEPGDVCFSIRFPAHRGDA